MDAQQLPLQQGLVTGSVAIGDTLSATILSAGEEAGFLRVKAGLFYSGIIAGCNCADDPTPVGAHPEYCEVELSIDKATAEATIMLVPDPHSATFETSPPAATPPAVKSPPAT